jgi:menaquinone-dependent protoporphyrinogen IX oxidase
MDERTLLAYISAGGATERYAHIVADNLRLRGHAVDVIDLKRDKDVIDLKRDKISDLSSYGSVIVGAGVRMGMVYRKGKRFLRRKDLEGKRLAIFLSSGIAVENPAKSKRKFLEPLVEKYGLHPIMCDAFPGKMPGAGGKLKDRTNPEIARLWAEELHVKLRGPA